jgi:hypothetical protein
MRNTRDTLVASLFLPTVHLNLKFGMYLSDPLGIKDLKLKNKTTIRYNSQLKNISLKY